jgi:hypothetical protein
MQQLQRTVPMIINWKNMNKILLMMLLAVSLAGCGNLWSFKTPEELAAIHKQEQEERIVKIIGLASIKKLYVGDFVNPKFFIVREDVQKLLKKAVRTRFDIVETPNISDGVMIAVNTDTSYPVIRLMDVKKATVVWSFECVQQTILWSQFQKLGCDSAEIVEKLLDDAQKVDDYIAKNPAKASVPDPRLN